MIDSMSYELPGRSERSARMAEQWRELATLVGVEPLSQPDRAACPIAVVTEDGAVFNVADVLLAFAEYVRERSGDAGEAQTRRNDAGE